MLLGVSILLTTVIQHLSVCIASATLLVYDGGTYDAGITTTTVGVAQHDVEGYSYLTLLLCHELLVVLVVPARTYGYICSGSLSLCTYAYI